MFAEFICIALAVRLLFCASAEERLAYEMSFDTLLKQAILIILLAVIMYPKTISKRTEETYQADSVIFFFISPISSLQSLWIVR